MALPITKRLPKAISRLIAGIDSEAIFDPKLNPNDRDSFDWLNANAANLGDYGLESSGDDNARYVFVVQQGDGDEMTAPGGQPLNLEMESPEDVLSPTPPEANAGGLTLNGGTTPPPPAIPTRSNPSLGIALRPLSPSPQQPSVTFRDKLRQV